MSLEDAFRKVRAEIESVTAAGGYFGEVTLKVEAGRVVVIHYHRTEK